MVVASGWPASPGGGRDDARFTKFAGKRSCFAPPSVLPDIPPRVGRSDGRLAFANQRRSDGDGPTPTLRGHPPLEGEGASGAKASAAPFPSRAFPDMLAPAKPNPGARPVSIEFLITSLIVVASPGTGVLYTLGTGLSRGARASIVAAFGCTVGIVPHMAAAIMGLAAILHTSALAFQIFKYLGVAYLLYMAWNTLKEHGALKVEKEVGARSALQVTVTAILVNILNPKLSIFFLAFLPQFVSTTEAHPLSRMLELSGVFMLMTFVVFVGYGLFAAAIRDHVISRPRVLTWMRRSFAAAFVGLGAKLALSER